MLQRILYASLIVLTWVFIAAALLALYQDRLGG
jgi:hypothetical protein